MLILSVTLSVRARVRMELPRMSSGNGMRRAIYYSLCCYSCGGCGCCECLYVLPLLLPSVLRLLQLILRVAAAAAGAAVCCHGFLKVGLPEAANDHYEIKCVSR